MKFIHTADVHLGMKPDAGKAYSKIREKEVAETFERLLETVQVEQPDLLLIAGDLFHRQPQLTELRELDYRLGELEHTEVVLIAGNHDYLESGSFYEKYTFQSPVTFLRSREMDQVYFPELETTVWGFSYHQREITDRCYDEYKPFGKGYHILLAHGGDSSHIPIQYQALSESGFDYIALGHIHKPGIIKENQMGYPGSLEPLDVTETGPHGYLAGEITKEGTRVRFVPFAKRQYWPLKIPVQEDITQAELQQSTEEAILRHGIQNIYHIIIEGIHDIHFEPDFYWLEQRYLISEVTDCSQESFELDQLYEENKDNIMGRLIGRLNREDSTEQEREALQYAVLALLRTQESQNE